MAKAGPDEKEEIASQGELQQINEQARGHFKSGIMNFESNKMAEAIAEFTEALKIDPKYADAYFNRALTYRIQQDYDSAQKDLEMVLKLQPKSWDAPLLIGDIAEARNDFLGARFWYEKALSNNPDYAEAKSRLEHIDSLIHIDAKIPQSGIGLQNIKQKYKEDMYIQAVIVKLFCMFRGLETEFEPGTTI